MFLTRPEIRNSSVTRSDLLRLKRELKEDLAYLENLPEIEKDDITFTMMSNLREDMTLVAKTLKTARK